MICLRQGPVLQIVFWRGASNEYPQDLWRNKKLFQNYHQNSSLTIPLCHIRCWGRDQFDLPAFGVGALWTLNTAISTMYLCPLCKLKTFGDVTMKLLINVKHHETMCRTKKKKKCNQFLEIGPLNIVDIENSHSTMYKEKGNHYENMPIHIYWKFYHQKMKIFR